MMTMCWTRGSSEMEKGSWVEEGEEKDGHAFPFWKGCICDLFKFGKVIDEINDVGIWLKCFLLDPVVALEMAQVQARHRRK